MKVNYKERIPSTNLSRWIWRYMSLTKLLSLVQTESLYFTPLCKFDDTREGTLRSVDFTKNDIKHYKSTSGHRNFGLCWFKSDFESLAMWKIYGSSHDSISIQSDLSLFNKCITDTRDWTIDIDKIQYAPLTSPNTFMHFYREPTDDDLFWYKDESFAYENEWRLIINFTEENYSMLDKSDKNGLNIKIDPNKLIEKIYVSPNCSQWRYESIKSILHDFGITASIQKSRIC